MADNSKKTGKKVFFPVYIGDCVYMHHRGNVWEYVITSIVVDKYGVTYHAYCEERMARLSFPEKWIGEEILLKRD